MERTTLGLPPCGAAVHASLAPAQPPQAPPAGLASSTACHQGQAKGAQMSNELESDRAMVVDRSMDLELLEPMVLVPIDRA